MISILVVCRRAAIVLAAICCAFTAVNLSIAKPRPAWPPLPEKLLRNWRFDDPNWITRPTSNALAAENLLLAESWSGYALDMPGGQSSLLLLPLLSGTSKPNLAPNAGTIRFWFSPYWMSVSAGGTGPGDWVRLVEIGNPADPLETFWITLALDPTGNLLTLAAKSDGQPLLYLQAAAAQWQPDAWHQIAIVYSSTNTLLVVDGAIAAATETPLPWPASAEWPQLAFAFGSALDGQDIARGQLEELTTFAFPLSIEYLAWHYQQFAPIATLGPISDESGTVMMTAMDAPPVPGDGSGGGSSGGGVTNPPSPPGLKLTKPIISGAVLATTLAEADTNNAYDIFQKLGLQPSNTWSRVAVGDIGQTNFSLVVPSTNHAFYMAAAVVDSDFDGLPDPFEELVLRTSPLSADSDGDGILDGNEDANLNGLPDYVDYNGLTRAIVYTTRANAYEGGQAGEVTLRLPSSAPTNNTKVTLHLGGNTDYDGDYWLAKPDGTRVTNDVFFVIGERDIRLQVHASNDTAQAVAPRRVSISLDSSANYQLDPQRADVTLIDNDLPLVSLVAPDAKAGEPSGTNVNPGMFVIRREGVTTNALTILLSISGSATAGTDYTNFTSPVVLPIGSNFVTIPINPIHDTNYEGDENVILTLQTSAAYVIDTTADSATVALADNDLPLVYFVGTDLVATEYNNLKAATVTLRRTGNTSQSLTVPLALSGTASNGVDHQFLTNSFTFAAGASDVTFNVRPLADTVEEAAESVNLVIKGSLAYNIGPSNAVTVFVDDSYDTRYVVLLPMLKQSASYDPALGVDSPALIDIYRYGRSLQAVNLPFTVKTNTPTGAKPTTFYRVYGDVSGTNAVFASFATRARLNFTAPIAVSQGSYGVDVQLPTIPGEFGTYVYSVFYQPAWQALSFSIIETNVVEGGSVQGRVRVSRKTTGPVSMTVGIRVAGQATAAVDHTLGSELYITLPANALSADATFTASTDTAVEGWESIVFSPMHYDVEIGFDPRSYMGFIRETSPAPEALPQYDYDHDGLPDRWELANGLDPFTAGEAFLDPDKDGVVTFDEYEFNTNPNSDDSDGDGQKDYLDLHRPLDPGPDYLAIRLQTRDTGKVNNGANCAVCHTTQLKVGEFSHYTKTSERGQFTDKTFYFRKGTNYPIYLTELMQNLSAATQETASPTTTATYSANVLSQTNQPRAFVVQDSQTKLGTNKPWSNFPLDPSASIGSLIVPKIDVTFTNISGNAALDGNTNAGGGLRVFPDQLSPTDFTLRNRLNVKVKTTPVMTNHSILLRWLDVDDPSANDAIVDPRDGSGEQGNDNSSNVTTRLAQTNLTLNAQGEATIEFTISMQAGDNFRVAAVLNTEGAQAHLDKLQVTDANALLYVTANTNAIPGFVGGISPLLTVWRKLHLEFDSMAAPPTSGPEANFVSGTITHAKLNSPVTGRSRIAVGHTQPWVNGLGQFAAGKIEISGVGAYAVTNGATFTSALDNRSSMGLDVLGTPEGNLIGLSAKVYDDDERYLANDSPLYESLVNLPSPPLPASGRSGEFINAMQFRFDPAYIKLVDANALGWNATQTIPFRRNAPAVDLIGNSVFDAGNLDLKGDDRPEFWCFSVGFGYQPGAGGDGDGHEEIPLSGGTPQTSPWLVGDNNRPFGYCVVFLESIRDYEFGVGRIARDPDPARFKDPQKASLLRSEYLGWIYGVIAHELGHGPGRQSEAADHDEESLMRKGGSNIDDEGWAAKTLRRFRTSPSWTR